MNNNFVSYVCSGITIICATLSTTEIAQLILYILGIVSACVSLVFNFIMWYKKAKSDGKITKEELQEGANIVNDGIKEITEKTNKEKK